MAAATSHEPSQLRFKPPAPQKAWSAGRVRNGTP